MPYLNGSRYLAIACRSPDRQVTQTYAGQKSVNSQGREVLSHSGVREFVL